jgi:hypothetical protein
LPGSNTGSLSDWYRKEKLPIKNDEQGERITPLCVRRDPLRIAAQRKSLEAVSKGAASLFLSNLIFF